jgi:serine/threonine protein kinase/formylglycine-generating enzyme required for sulfatase activity
VTGPGGAAPGSAADAGLPARYEVRSFLGQGGMGRVYLCRDSELDVIVAVKVLASHLAADPTALEQIRAEARAVAKFRGCANILSLYSFEQYQGSWYLVMEFAAGGALDDRLKRDGKMPEAECRRLGAEVAEALHYAHRHRVLHRDIKPANILLDASGRAKVADFGIAKILQGEQQSTSTLSISGTPVYMPPEAVLRGPLDARSDLYSLGCMLYEMATGKRPYKGTPLEIFMSKTSEGTRVPDPRQIAPEVSADYAAIVGKASAPSPGDRYADGAALAKALRAGLPPEAEESASTMTSSHASVSGGDLPTMKEPGGAPQVPAATAPVPAAKAPVPAAEAPRAEAPPAFPPRRRSLVPIVAGVAVLLVGGGIAAALLSGGEKPLTPDPGVAKAPPKDPPKDPPKETPPKESPPKESPPKETPPKETPPKEVPPTPDPPKEAPPKESPPKESPPKEKPFGFAVPGLPAPPALPPGFTPPKGFRVVEGRVACEKDGAEMVLVPAGEFPMGSEIAADAGSDDELPEHNMKLGAYLIDRHEVTVGQFRRFCEERGRVLPVQPGSMEDRMPVVNISYELATEYASWAGKRLPTEAEWERAARGTDKRLYPWGNEPDPERYNGLGAEDGFVGLAPCGSFPKGASPVGCLDMSGNAAEWCSDWYRKDAYRLPEADNPRGPTKGDDKELPKRVLRGGNMKAKKPSLVRAAIRNSAAEGKVRVDAGIGFRCVVSVP